MGTDCRRKPHTCLQTTCVGFKGEQDETFDLIVLGCICDTSGNIDSTIKRNCPHHLFVHRIDKKLRLSFTSLCNGRLAAVS